MKRYLQNHILEDLVEKMVFLGGPRQVGKTTLSLDCLAKEEKQDKELCYYNWDNPKTRELLMSGEVSAEAKYLIFDEIHKYKDWRNVIKGFYDTYKNQKKILVTGSARLDYYRKGGDSLQGRYHYYRLHPLSVAEVVHSQSDLLQLLTFGGFPEPFLKANLRHYKRWQKERSARVLQDDLNGLEMVKEISQLEILTSLLPHRVGSILSINNLREQLYLSHETVERYITILENIYFCYRIPPYCSNQFRSIKKEKKLYLWDWSLAQNEGARFENMVASHLLKYCHFYEDTEGEDMGLYFLRDTEKRELDFLCTRNGKILFAVECKTGEKSLSTRVGYFRDKLNIPITYQVHLGSKNVELPNEKARILPFVEFCKEIGVP